jgi:uncharacterized protein (TIGR02647 family)
MPFSNEMFEEIKILSMFDVSSTAQGLKVHSTAGQEAIAATERLFDKGLISQPDGGYLTQFGIETAAHVDALITVLGSKVPEVEES